MAFLSQLPVLATRERFMQEFQTLPLTPTIPSERERQSLHPSFLLLILSSHFLACFLFLSFAQMLSFAELTEYSEMHEIKIIF